MGVKGLLQQFLLEGKHCIFGRRKENWPSSCGVQPCRDGDEDGDDKVMKTRREAAVSAVTDGAGGVLPSGTGFKA